MALFNGPEILLVSIDDTIFYNYNIVLKFQITNLRLVSKHISTLLIFIDRIHDNGIMSKHSKIQHPSRRFPQEFFAHLLLESFQSLKRRKDSWSQGWTEPGSFQPEDLPSRIPERKAIKIWNHTQFYGAVTRHTFMYRILLIILPGTSDVYGYRCSQPFDTQYVQRGPVGKAAWSATQLCARSCTGTAH